MREILNEISLLATFPFSLKRKKTSRNEKFLIPGSFLHWQRNGTTLPIMGGTPPALISLTKSAFQT